MGTKKISNKTEFTKNLKKEISTKTYPPKMSEKEASAKINILPKKFKKASIKKYRPNSNTDFQLDLLSQLSKDFSGAEIEQCVIDAMRIGFSESREFNYEDILTAIKNIVPLAKTKSRELDQLREWVESGNILNASKY